jgi:hypothetical protein
MLFVREKFRGIKKWIRWLISTKRDKPRQEENEKLITEKPPLVYLNRPIIPSTLNTHNFSPLSPDEKIALFMDLFQGRRDVFPKRWENPKTSKSGYSPACHNEWVKGVCRKPHIKCSECLNQAFIPVTDHIIRKHFTGEKVGDSRRDHTIGIYPMLKDETCWFLSVDFDIHRLHHSKKEVIVYDYVDRSISMLARMADKRIKGYGKLGYSVE